MYFAYYVSISADISWQRLLKVNFSATLLLGRVVVWQCSNITVKSYTGKMTNYFWQYFCQNYGILFPGWPCCSTQRLNQGCRSGAGRKGGNLPQEKSGARVSFCPPKHQNVQICMYNIQKFSHDIASTQDPKWDSILSPRPLPLGTPVLCTSCSIVHPPVLMPLGLITWFSWNSSWNHSHLAAFQSILQLLWSKVSWHLGWGRTVTDVRRNSRCVDDVVQRQVRNQRIHFHQQCHWLTNAARRSEHGNFHLPLLFQQTAQ